MLPGRGKKIDRQYAERGIPLDAAGAIASDKLAATPDFAKRYGLDAVSIARNVEAELRAKVMIEQRASDRYQINDDDASKFETGLDLHRGSDKLTVILRRTVPSPPITFPSISVHEAPSYAKLEEIVRERHWDGHPMTIYWTLMNGRPYVASGTFAFGKDEARQAEWNERMRVISQAYNPAQPPAPPPPELPAPSATAPQAPAPAAPTAASIAAAAAALAGDDEEDGAEEEQEPAKPARKPQKPKAKEPPRKARLPIDEEDEEDDDDPDDDDEDDVSDNDDFYEDAAENDLDLPAQRRRSAPRPAPRPVWPPARPAAPQNSAPAHYPQPQQPQQAPQPQPQPMPQAQQPAWASQPAYPQPPQATAAWQPPGGYPPPQAPGWTGQAPYPQQAQPAQPPQQQAWGPPSPASPWQPQAAAPPAPSPPAWGQPWPQAAQPGWPVQPPQPGAWPGTWPQRPVIAGYDPRTGQPIYAHAPPEMPAMGMGLGAGLGLGATPQSALLESQITRHQQFVEDSLRAERKATEEALRRLDEERQQTLAANIARSELQSQLARMTDQIQALHRRVEETPRLMQMAAPPPPSPPAPAPAPPAPAPPPPPPPYLMAPPAPPPVPVVAPVPAAIPPIGSSLRMGQASPYAGAVASAAGAFGAIRAAEASADPIDAMVSAFDGYQKLRSKAAKSLGLIPKEELDAAAAAAAPPPAPNDGLPAEIVPGEKFPETVNLGVWRAIKRDGELVTNPLETWHVNTDHIGSLVDTLVSKYKDLSQTYRQQHQAALNEQQKVIELEERKMALHAKRVELEEKAARAAAAAAAAASAAAAQPRVLAAAPSLPPPEVAMRRPGVRAAVSPFPVAAAAEAPAPAFVPPAAAPEPASSPAPEPEPALPFAVDEEPGGSEDEGIDPFDVVDQFRKLSLEARPPSA